MAEISQSMEVIKHVKLKGDLLSHYSYLHLRGEIEKLLRAIPEIEKLKLNPEVTELVAIIVENTVKKKSKIDKKTLVIEGLSLVFSYSPDEIKQLEDQIEYMYKKGMIVKISYFYKTYKYFKSFFF